MTWAHLSELLRVEGLAQVGTERAAAATVTGIAYDSRHVQPGNVFVALKGQHADGGAFARQAIERGAIAIVSEDAAPENVAVAWMVVNDARRALALLAAVTGFCTGCEIYRLGARLRGVGHGELRRIDRADVGGDGDELVVHFTHPLCSDCLAVEQRLRAEGRTLVTVDVRERPDLARKYGIGIVPTAVAVAADGAVTARLA
jgi:hypothetical protein